MLPHYSPLKVAETFSSLSGLHPERIDLGLGRAPGTDPMTMLALQRDRRHAARRRLHRAAGGAARRCWRTGCRRTTRSPATPARCPGLPERPEPWLLGSSPQSALWAAELGLPYSFADFINPQGAAIAADYRGRFVDSERLAAPLVSVGVIAICADTDEEAERLAASSRMMLSLLRQGRLIEIPPVEKALRYLETRDARQERPARGDRLAGARCGPASRRWPREYGAEELLVLTITHDHAARRRSYELIAEAFGLAAGQPSSSVATPR